MVATPFSAAVSSGAQYSWQLEPPGWQGTLEDGGEQVLEDG